MIGVFDSGSGGTNILKECLAVLPNQSFIYLGDHARAPYGEKSADEIYGYTGEMTQHLFELGCSLVLLACNTAATIALRRLQEDWLHHQFPKNRILGVHIPLIEQVTAMDWDRHSIDKNIDIAKTVILFGTPMTIESGTYEIELQKRAPNCQLMSVACPGLVDAIEKDMPVKEIDALVEGFVKKALNACKSAPDSVILGCTHYPLALDSFKRFLPAETDIINQAHIVAQSLKTYLERHPNYRTFTKDPICKFLTTGEPDNISSFANVFGNTRPSFEKLSN